MSMKDLKVSTEAAPVRMQTVNNLREAIIEGRFKPGQRMYEQELCDLTGVSRTTIREALRQLESEGLVATLPNKGPIVTQVTLEEAKDIYQIREVLESLAVRLFAENADDDQMASLANAFAKMEKALETNSTRELMRAKNEYQDILFSSCGNLLIQKMTSSLRARVNFIQAKALSIPDRARKCVSENKMILAALQNRDPGEAEDTCKQHIRNATQMALTVLQARENATEF